MSFSRSWASLASLKVASPLWANISVHLSPWAGQSQVTTGAILSATSAFHSHSTWAAGFHPGELALSNSLVHGMVWMTRRAQKTWQPRRALNLGSFFLSLCSAGNLSVCHLIQGTLGSLKCLSHSCLVGPGARGQELTAHGLGSA